MSLSNRAATGRKKGQRRGTRDAEVLPDSASLAQFMLDIEKDKRESNRLLARIEENTAHQCAGTVTIRDFIKLYPPTFHHSIEPLDAND